MVCLEEGVSGGRQRHFLHCDIYGESKEQRPKPFSYLELWTNIWYETEVYSAILNTQ